MKPSDPLPASQDAAPGHRAPPAGASPPVDPHTAAERVVSFFEHLSVQRLDELPELYAANALFKDPFNEVRGHAAIERIFRHMYVQVLNPRFEITDRVVDAGGAVLMWTFRFRFRSAAPSAEQAVRGVTHLRFDPEGRIAVHRDYWDAAEELYAKLPVLGALMRWLQRRMAAASP